MKTNFKTKIERSSGLWFVLPTALTLGLLVIYPLLYGVYISLFDTNLMTRWDFVGLKYYVETFLDPYFIRKVYLTLKFTFLVVIGHFVIGTGLALVLNNEFPGRSVFRAILITPWLFPEVVVALLWRWMFNPMYGFINHYLLKFNLIADPISWLGNPSTAMSGVIAAAIWKGYPLVLILVLAGLQAIPDELYEAGKIDGGSRWQLFRYVTLPSLRHVLVVTLILDTVWWFKHFTIIWVLTQGGPVDATSVISIDIYKQAFEYFRFGRAGAMAVLVFLICFAIGYVYRRMLGDEED